jgi:ribosomal protein S10
MGHTKRVRKQKIRKLTVRKEDKQMTSTNSNSYQASVYRRYCTAIAEATGYTGQQLSDEIANSNRDMYEMLFGNREIRQRNMDSIQLEQLMRLRSMVADELEMGVSEIRAADIALDILTRA